MMLFQTLGHMPLGLGQSKPISQTASKTGFIPIAINILNCEH